METVYILLKRKPGMSFEAFREHYESSHAKLGEKYFGHLFKSYRRHYIPSGRRFSDGEQVENAYDCVTELVFKDEGGHDELIRIATQPEVHQVLADDEARFLDRSACANAPSHLIESDLSQP